MRQSTLKLYCVHKRTVLYTQDAMLSQRPRTDTANISVTHLKRKEKSVKHTESENVYKLLCNWYGNKILQFPVQWSSMYSHFTSAVTDSERLHPSSQKSATGPHELIQSSPSCTSPQPPLTRCDHVVPQPKMWMLSYARFVSDPQHAAKLQLLSCCRVLQSLVSTTSEHSTDIPMINRISNLFDIAYT